MLFTETEINNLFYKKRLIITIIMMSFLVILFWYYSRYPQLAETVTNAFHIQGLDKTLGLITHKFMMPQVIQLVLF